MKNRLQNRGAPSLRVNIGNAALETYVVVAVAVA